MSLHTVSDLSDAVALESNLGLYLKPVSRIKINVQLPKHNLPGQSISSWHAMEKLKETVRPDSFLYIKSLKITPAVIKFEGELETKATCERALARLRAAGSLKIIGFQEKLQVRAAHATAAGPTRHDWEAFFRDAKGVNEMKPGERPDTIHLKELPVKWFVDKGQGKGHGPNDKLIRLAFGSFGKIRRLEVPVRTETDGENSIGKTGMQKDALFEVYIQYEEFVEFAIAMDSLRGKKLLYKDPGGKVYSADIKVDFDRTKYLSEACIKKREAEEKKLNPPISVKVEKEFAKNISSSTSPAKKSLQEPLKKHSPPKEKKVTSQPISTKDLKTQVKNANQTFEVEKKSRLEAKFLLRELLLRAEKTERHKEEAKKVEANLTGRESQKRPKESTSSDAHPKKTKTVKETICKELEECKIKHSQSKLVEVKRDKKEHKIEKRTHSEEKKTAKPSSKIEEKRIKVMDDNKEGDRKLKSVSKNEERTPKYHENRYEETKVLTDCDKTNKDKTSKHVEINKNREESGQMDKLNNVYISASDERKGKDKRSFSDCDKTNKDYRSDEKRHKQKEILMDCDETNDYNKISKHGKHEDSELHIEKDRQEVIPEKEMEDEQARMYLEEKKLKERLIQSYNQKKRNKERLLAQERILKEKLLRNLRAREEEKLKEREKLRRELSGRKVLKSVVGGTCSLSKRN